MNLFRFTPSVSSAGALGPGRHTVRYDFVYDGGKPGSGGTSKLSVDGRQSAEAKVLRTMPFIYSADEGADVGVDNETPSRRSTPSGRTGSWAGSTE
jgi:hypothetical protein